MKTWTKYPFVRLLIPLMAGIILSKIAGSIIQFPIYVLAVPLIVIPFLRFLPEKPGFKGRWVYGLLLNTFLLLTGYQLYALKQMQGNDHFSKVMAGGLDAISGIVAEEPSERANSHRLVIKVDALYSNGRRTTASGKIMVYLPKDSAANAVSYGDRIVFSEPPVEIKGSGNPGEFNYSAYLANKNIYHQVYLRSGRYQVIGHNYGNALKSFAISIRNNFLKIFRDAGIDGREYAVAAALLTGYDDLLDPDQRREFAGAGAMHILCVSGLHVGIIFLLADKLLFFLPKRKKSLWIRPVLILLIIWLYALITGLAPSVLRASLMFSLVTIGGSLNRKSHIINTLSASAFILLLIDPGLLYNLGFQLSYFAVLGIVVFLPPIAKLYTPTQKVPKYIWDIVTVSLAAQIATGPLSLMYFNQFPNFFLITNIIVIPLSGILIYSGLAFSLLAQIPVISGWAAQLLVFEFKILNYSVAFIEGLPGAVTRNLYLSGPSTLLLYLLILSLFAWLVQRKIMWFRTSLALVSLLALQLGYQKFQNHARHEIIFHKINGGTAISLTQGTQHTLILDSALMVNPGRLTYPLNGYVLKNKLKTHKVLLGDSTVQLNNLLIYRDFIKHNNINLAIVNNSRMLPDSAQRIKVDYVLLQPRDRIPVDVMLKAFPEATFVISGNISRRKADFLKTELTKQGAKIHSLLDDGALIARL